MFARQYLLNECGDPHFFFGAINNKSIDTVRTVFWLGFYGSFIHKLRFLQKDFPPKVPIFWNTNVKNTNITPKYCHIVLLTLTSPTP